MLALAIGWVVGGTISYLLTNNLETATATTLGGFGMLGILYLNGYIVGV